MKVVGEGMGSFPPPMGSFPPPRPNVEPVIDKKSIATQPDASFLIVNESTVKDTTNVSISLEISNSFILFFFDDCVNSLGLAFADKLVSCILLN